MTTNTMGGGRRRGFTLVELLVVISILILVLAIAVPAFSSMLYSSERSLADNALRVALNGARTTAIGNAAGEDAAAVFTFEPGGRVGVVTCVRAGVMHDVQGADHTDFEVFVPAKGVEPVQLPKGWSVRGYARSDMIDDPANSANQNYQNWYADTYPTQAVRDQGNWVFPETGFYVIGDETFGGEAAQGKSRHTFMVRFEGGTGQVLTSGGTVRVLLPSPSSTFRTGAPWNSIDTSDGRALYRADQADDLLRYVRRVIASTSLDPADRKRLLGIDSTDTVGAKAVGQLALYNESRLANAIGVRLDRDTSSLYQNATKDKPYATWVKAAEGKDWGTQNTSDLNEWIEGRLLRPGAQTGSEDFVESDARVFALQRYLGGIVEVTGSTGGKGVSP